MGRVHEEHGAGPAEENEMDLWNNLVGSAIGAEAVSAGASGTWAYVMNECDSKARSE